MIRIDPVTLRCLEFCGFGHELMTNTLEVRTS
jgi:heme/copper-type cytochrome/quinol oxidase subunit 2